MKASATINDIGDQPKLRIPGLIPAAILVPFLTLVLARAMLPEWAVIVPEAWIIPFVDWINAVVDEKSPSFSGFSPFAI